MKPILISMQKPHTDNIKAGIKKIEVRKDRPKQEPPFPCYIYETKAKGGCGKVIGEFVCDWITEINPHCDIDGWVNQYIHSYPAILGDDCLSFNEMKTYLGNKKGYDWHISDLKIYDKPKELREFKNPCIDKYMYCQGCKYGFTILSPDEEEYAFYHGGYYDSFDTVCTNTKKRPPQSWCYVEE